MYYFKFVVCVISFFLISCTPTVQNSGLTEVKFHKININIGKTSKKDLIENYGPPVFESVFNKNVIYYISHRSSYKLLDKSKTQKLLVYEIELNEKNIVESFKEYSEKDSLDIIIADDQIEEKDSSVFIWKEILNNMRRNNIQN